jgi:hypothetical protein
VNLKYSRRQLWASAVGSAAIGGGDENREGERKEAVREVVLGAMMTGTI